MQAQVREPAMLVQLPKLASQPPFSTRHSSTSYRQVGPEKPLQLHWKPSRPSVQVPPFEHGWLTHSSMLLWQEEPERPGGQRQPKLPRPSTQVPPLAQLVPSAQSSMFVWHSWPV